MSFILQPTKEHPIVIAVGNSPPIHITESDWPKAMWSCDLSECVIPDMEDTIVSVKSGECSVKVTLLEGIVNVLYLVSISDYMNLVHITKSLEIFYEVRYIGPC